MRGGSDDPVGFVLGSLLELFRAFPLVGLLGAGAFAGLSVYIQRLPPEMLHGKVHLFLVVTWPFACLSLLMAVVGFVGHRGEERALRANPSVEDLMALERPAFVHLIGELYRQRGFAVSPAPAPADLMLRKEELGTVLVFAALYRSREISAADLLPFLGTITAWATQVEGIIVTCGELSNDALAFTQDKPLILVDGRQILTMIALPPEQPVEKA
jgi:hypothetical protein